MFIKLKEASVEMTDDMQPEFTPRREIVVNSEEIGMIRDHVVMVQGRNIQVMETADQICRILVDGFRALHNGMM